MSLKDLEFVVLDLQTTGFVPQYSHIVEMAWARVESRNGQLLLGPIHTSMVELPEGETLSRNIREITGLSDDDFKEAGSLPDLIVKLSEDLSGGRPLLCHYARFEKSFLAIHAPEFSETISPSYLCTFDIAKRLYPDLPCRNLPALAGYFGHPHIQKKRASSHVQATYWVWKSIVDELEASLSIYTLDELRDWLAAKPSKEKAKTRFLIPKAVRDAVPQSPGVYRFLNKHDEILYIGKAINLKQRLKSYFQNSSLRGRKREMMTQASDLKFDLAANEIHAALLETDLIKKHKPPYNVALQERGRDIFFFSKDYLTYSGEQGPEFPFGPYTQPQDFAGFQALIEGKDSGLVSSLIFYGFMTAEEFEPGWLLFKERYLRDEKLNMRKLIALGLKFYKYYASLEEEFIEEEAESFDEEAKVLDEEVPYTPEEVCSKLERRLAGIARQYLRVQGMAAMLNVEFRWEEKGKICFLKMADGKAGIGPSKEYVRTVTAYPWSGKTISDYDRIRVLLTEVLLRLRRGEEIDYRFTGTASKSYFFRELAKRTS